MSSPLGTVTHEDQIRFENFLRENNNHINGVDYSYWDFATLREFKKENPDHEIFNPPYKLTFFNCKTIEDVKQCIKEEHDVNEMFLNRAPIFVCKNDEHMELLLDHGADVNIENSIGQRPLLFAETAKQTRMLLEAGSDPNHADTTEGSIALFYARSIEQVKLLLDAGTDINHVNLFGQNALFYIQEPEVCQFLIDQGINVFQTDESGDTALHQCSSKEKAEVLIKVGVDVNQGNMYGIKPIQRYTLNETGIFSFLLTAGACIDMIDDKGETMLFNEYMPSENFKLLIEAGIDVNHKNKKDLTVLDFLNDAIKDCEEGCQTEEQWFIENLKENRRLVLASGS